jgi:arylsulfatase
MSDAGRNIVLVTVDSLRADHCGHLGTDRELTSTLDDLAADGVAYRNAVAPGPQTFSSMPAAFTGRRRPPGDVEDYPGATHWQRRLAAIDGHLRRHGSFPERLRKLGYATAGFSPNPWTSTAAGFDRGFEYFTDLSSQETGLLQRLVGAIPGLDTDRNAVELGLDLLTGSSFFTRWEQFFGDVQLLRERLPEPYFLWVFLLDTHYPYLVTRDHRVEQSWLGMYRSAYRSERAMRGHTDSMPEVVRQSLRRSYRDSIRAVDAFLEELVAAVAGDDPAVIVHSDHGESLGEHRRFGHDHRQVYDENVHVPFVVHDAGARATVDEPVSLAAIPDLALSIAREGTVDPRTVTHPTVIATSEGGTNRTVRGRRYKYLESGAERALFDLRQDPGESTDVSEAHPDVVEEYRETLDHRVSHLEETDRLAEATGTLAAGDEF